MWIKLWPSNSTNLQPEVMAINTDSYRIYRPWCKHFLSSHHRFLVFQHSHDSGSNMVYCEGLSLLVLVILMIWETNYLCLVTPTRDYLQEVGVDASFRYHLHWICCFALLLFTQQADTTHLYIIRHAYKCCHRSFLFNSTVFVNSVLKLVNHQNTSSLSKFFV